MSSFVVHRQELYCRSPQSYDESLQWTSKASLPNPVGKLKEYVLGVRSTFRCSTSGCVDDDDILELRSAPYNAKSRILRRTSARPTTVVERVLPVTLYEFSCTTSGSVDGDDDVFKQRSAP